MENGNHQWQDEMDVEIALIKEYGVFKDYEKAKWEGETITNAPPGHQKTRVHFGFAVKHCGNLWGGWLLMATSWNLCTQELFLSDDSDLVIFLAELNKLLLWGGDVGNTYLEALTKEKLYITAGPEFGELQGHILIIYKGLYGTRTGGACWHDKLFDTLHHMGFQPSKADPDIWMKTTDDGQAYEYIAVYVDDLCVASKDPGKIFQTLKNKYKLKLKGDGPLDYHLGCSYK